MGSWPYLVKIIYEISGHSCQPYIEGYEIPIVVGNDSGPFNIRNGMCKWSILPLFIYLGLSEFVGYC